MTARQLDYAIIFGAIAFCIAILWLAGRWP